MPIPDYQTMMRPCLLALADGAQSQQQIRDVVAKALEVSDEDRQEMLPSGKQSTYSNRIGWAISYLRHAGLVESAGRDTYKVTERGREALQANPERIDISVLSGYEEFRDFRAGSKKLPTGKPAGGPIAEDVSGAQTSTAALTPNDAIEAIVSAAQQELITDLVARVYSRPPAFLERLSLTLLKAMGYGGLDARFEHTGGSGDKGLDGVIRQDALGLDRIGVQAKRYDPEGAPIPGKDVQAFAGALDEVTAQRGVFVTTAAFSKAAHDSAAVSSKHIVLIDGRRLATLMLQYGVGVEVQQSFALHNIDEAFFED